MTLSDAELDRYARQLILPELGGAGQATLRGAHVVLVGLGGIGCPAAQSLATMGVGRLRLIDDDLVALDNLPRQTLFGEADVGRAKVEVGAERLRALNHYVAVEPVVGRVDVDTVERLIADADLVLDGCDNFATRLLISDASVRLRVPLVSAAVGQFQGQVGIWRGWLPDQPCYRCFVGDAFDADDCDTCAELGVLGAMTAWTASLAALEVVRALRPFGAAPGLRLLDGLAGTVRPLTIPKDPSCKGCGQLR